MFKIVPLRNYRLDISRQGLIQHVILKEENSIEKFFIVFIGFDFWLSQESKMSY